MTAHSYEIFVTAEDDSVLHLVERIQAMLRDELGLEGKVEVMNIFDNQGSMKAVSDDVFVVPSVQRVQPEPRKRVVLNLGDEDGMVLLVKKMATESE